MHYNLVIIRKMGDMNVLTYEKILLSLGFNLDEILDMSHSVHNEEEFIKKARNEIYKRIIGTKCALCLEKIYPQHSISRLQKCNCFFHEHCLCHFIESTNYHQFGCPKCLFKI